MDLSVSYTLFKGFWRFDRRVASFAGRPLGNLGKAQGQAVFVSKGPLLLAYREEGQHNALGLDFFRHYTYALVGEEIHVLYGDGPQAGQLYQRLTFDAAKNQLISKEEHLCGADCYSSLYAFSDDDRFTLETTVRGPRKDYTLSTEFTRLKF